MGSPGGQLAATRWLTGLGPWVLAFAGALGILGIAPIAGFGTHAVDANTPTTADFFAFDSVDHYIGQGDTVVVTDQTGDVAAGLAPGSAEHRSVWITVQHPDGRMWFLRFIAPYGQALEVGTYRNAGRGFEGDPELRISRSGSGCNQHDGTFVIHELAWGADGVPAAFAASFEHRCDSQFGAMVGRVRVNSELPIGALSLPHGSRSFVAIAGELSESRTYTIESSGELPVDVTSVVIGGPAADEYLLADECAGRTLLPGEQCSFEVAFAPLEDGERDGLLAIEHSAPLAELTLPLGGWGLIPTSLTARVVPDWVYFRPGIGIQVTTEPEFEGGEFECWLDGELSDKGGLGPGGVFCVRPRELGSHTYQVRFLGDVWHGPSSSPLMTFEASTVTTTHLSLETPFPANGRPVTVSAEVRASEDLLYPGGTVTVVDTTTGSTLGTFDIDAQRPSWELSPFLGTGSHHLVATYSGVPGILDGSTTSLEISVAPVLHSTYVAVTPNRVLDTRYGNGLSGTFHVGKPRTFQVTNRHPGDVALNVPAEAIAVTGNLTATGTGSDGWLTVTPTAESNPPTSTLNLRREDNRANGVTVPLGLEGTLSIVYNGAPVGADTHAIFDVTGYFVPGNSGATYVSLTPSRLLDSRFGNGLSGAFRTDQPRSFQVTNRNPGNAGLNVPATAIAVTGNVTVTGQSHAGWVSVTPLSDQKPSTSTLNFPIGDNRANGLTVPLGPGGRLYVVYNGAPAAATTHVLFDVTGYYLPGTSGARFVPLVPNRILDSRYANGFSGKLQTDRPRSFTAANRAANDPSRNVPTSAVAVTGNLTVTGQTRAGWLTVSPISSPRPPTSTLNFPVGDNRANGVTVALGSGSVAVVFNGARTSDTTHAIFDVTGYFEP
jgi:hypothetical protein